MAFELYSKVPIRFWGTEEMTHNVRKVYKYLSTTYFHNKRHLPRFLAIIIGFIAAPFVRLFYRGLDVIAVEKGAAVVKTMKESEFILREYKENIVIFPEDSSKGYFNEISYFYAGFMLLAEYCYKKGMNLKIMVCNFHKKEKVLVFDKPVQYSELVKDGASREEVAEQMRIRCNELRNINYK